MNTIKRDVYVLKNTIKIPIEITQGTDMIGIEFTVRDFTIPATAAVVAYANHKSMSRPNSALCELADNVIAFSPSSGFFAVGMNELQIRIINEDKTLVSFGSYVSVGYGQLNDGKNGVNNDRGVANIHKYADDVRNP